MRRFKTLLTTLLLLAVCTASANDGFFPQNAGRVIPLEHAFRDSPATTAPMSYDQPVVQYANIGSPQRVAVPVSTNHMKAKKFHPSFKHRAKHHKRFKARTMARIKQNQARMKNEQNKRRQRQLAKHKKRHLTLAASGIAPVKKSLFSGHSDKARRTANHNPYYVH